MALEVPETTRIGTEAAALDQPAHPAARRCLPQATQEQCGRETRPETFLVSRAGCPQISSISGT